MFEKLIKAGYTEEEAKKIEKIFNEHLDGNYVTKDRFNTVNEDNKNLKNQLKDRDAQLDKLGKAGNDVETLKQTIEALKQENKTTKEKYESDLKQAKIKSAVKSKISNEVHDPDLVLSLFDLNKIELDDNDNIKTGFEDQYINLKKEKSYLIKTPEKPQIKLEGVKGFEGNKESNPNQSEGFGTKLANMKLGSETPNSKATDYYFKK